MHPFSNRAGYKHACTISTFRQILPLITLKPHVLFVDYTQHSPALVSAGKLLQNNTTKCDIVVAGRTSPAMLASAIGDCPLGPGRPELNARHACGLPRGSAGKRLRPGQRRDWLPTRNRMSLQLGRGLQARLGDLACWVREGTVGRVPSGGSTPGVCPHASEVVSMAAAPLGNKSCWS